jgi:phosphoglycerate dehydrogenase-like enzyme
MSHESDRIMRRSSPSSSSLMNGPATLASRASSGLHLCVYHPTMGSALGERLASLLPHVQLSVSSCVDADPPCSSDIEALVAFRFPPGLLLRMPRLRWLQLTSAGFDQVSGECRPDLLVTHAGSIPARAVAEFVIMGLLAFARNAPQLVRQHDRRLWSRPGARLIHGSTLALVGLGRIGAEVSARARALGMRVIAVTRSGTARVPVDHCYGPDGLGQAASEADYLAVCVPDTPRTRRLVGAEVFEQLKPGCSIIDVSRPAIVDRDALRAALRNGRCANALLDVHGVEPLPEHDPLWREEGLWITPHCAFEQDREVEALTELIADNVERLLAGAPLRNLVPSGDAP